MCSLLRNAQNALTKPVHSKYAEEGTKRKHPKKKEYIPWSLGELDLFRSLDAGVRSLDAVKVPITVLTRAIVSEILSADSNPDPNDPLSLSDLILLSEQLEAPERGVRSD